MVSEIEWLKSIVAKAGKGTIDNIDARAVGRIIQSLEASNTAQSSELEKLRDALKPFARFFKDDEHDLSPSNDAMIVMTFLDQTTHLPLAELTMEAFRKAYSALEIGDM